MTHELELYFETYETGTPVQCLIEYQIQYDSGPFDIGEQTVWHSYYETEVLSTNFTLPGGTKYVPTTDELADWEKDIPFELRRDARNNVRGAA